MATASTASPRLMNAIHTDRGFIAGSFGAGLQNRHRCRLDVATTPAGNTLASMALLRWSPHPRLWRMQAMTGISSDADRVVRAQAGDRDAFASLVQAHGRMAYAQAYRHVGN